MDYTSSQPREIFTSLHKGLGAIGGWMVVYIAMAYAHPWLYMSNIGRYIIGYGSATQAWGNAVLFQRQLFILNYIL